MCDFLHSVRALVRLSYAEHWESVFEYMKKRGAPAEEIESVRSVSRTFTNN